jgi:hypothetical protein
MESTISSCGLLLKSSHFVNLFGAGRLGAANRLQSGVSSSARYRPEFIDQVQHAPCLADVFWILRTSLIRQENEDSMRYLQLTSEERYMISALQRQGIREER